MAVRSGYRQTEVGVLPEDWDARVLGDGVVLLSGQHVMARHCNTSGDGVPYVTGPADFPDGTIRHSKYTRTPGVVCQASDILITVKGSGAGTLILSDAPYCISRQLMAIRVKGWNTKFVYYSLMRVASQFGTAAAGLIPGLSRNDIMNRVVWAPQIEAEQSAIASALSDADALVGSLESLIAKKRNIKQGAMQQLLTGQKRLPGFSGEWATTKLGEVFQFLRTAHNPRSDLSQHGSVKYIHYGDVHASRSPFIDCDKHQLYSIDASRVTNVPFLEDGDLVVVDASEDYVGLAKSVEVKNATGRKIVAGLHTLLLRGSRDRVSDSFKGYFQFIPAVRQGFIRMATGISVFGISKNKVKNIEARLPDTKEQSAIAEVLREMDAEIAALECKLAKARLIKQGMMQELLTGRRRLV